MAEVSSPGRGLYIRFEKLRAGINLGSLACCCRASPIQARLVAIPTEAASNSQICRVHTWRAGSRCEKARILRA